MTRYSLTPYKLSSPGGSFTHPDEEQAQEELFRKKARQKKEHNRQFHSAKILLNAKLRHDRELLDRLHGIIHVNSFTNTLHIPGEIKEVDYLALIERDKIKPVITEFIDKDCAGYPNKNMGHTKNAPRVSQDLIVVKPVIDGKIIDIEYRVPVDSDYIELIYTRLKEGYPALASLYGVQDAIETNPEQCYIIIS